MTKMGVPQRRSVFDQIGRAVVKAQRVKPDGYVKPVATPKSARSPMVVKAAPALRDPQGVLGHAPRPRKRRRR